MKKFLVLLTILLSAGVVGAQGRFGLVAGTNYTSFKPESATIETIKSASGFHAGIAYQVRVPFVGLAMQPELLYSQKSFEAENGTTSETYTMNYVELPINIQWGINLLLLRPFVFASPYASYAVSKSGELSDVAWDDLNRFDYGVGLGAGVEIWKFQISGKYNWSMKSFDSNDHLEFGNAKFNGFQLSLALLF
jgi:hypothetical protein